MATLRFKNQVGSTGSSNGHDGDSGKYFVDTDVN